MKSVLVSDLREKSSKADNKTVDNRALALARVRRFQEADERLQAACARLGIEKPNMVS